MVNVHLSPLAPPLGLAARQTSPVSGNAAERPNVSSPDTFVPLPVDLASITLAELQEFAPALFGLLASSLCAPEARVRLRQLVAQRGGPPVRSFEFRELNQPAKDSPLELMIRDWHMDKIPTRADGPQDMDQVLGVTLTNVSRAVLAHPTKQEEGITRFRELEAKYQALKAEGGGNLSPATLDAQWALLEEARGLGRDFVRWERGGTQ